MLEDQRAQTEDVDDVEVLKSQSVGFGDGAKESKKRKRNLITVAEDESDIKKEKIYKRTILALTKPSYLLSLGSGYVRPENRRRLCWLLQKLVKQHNWREASGVLSLLLKVTHRNNSPSINRFKYSVLIELLSHVESVDFNLKAINGIYDTWMSKIGINLARVNMEKGVFIVCLESILFRLAQGDFEDEHHNARSLIDEHKFVSHPVLHMIIGLIFFTLWYSNLPEDMQWKDSNQIFTPTNSEISVSHSQVDISATRFSYKIGGSEVSSGMPSSQCNSEASVMNHNKVSVKADSVLHKEVESMEVDNKPQTIFPLDIQPTGFYVDSGENEVSVENKGGHMHSIPNLFALESLDAWLLPIQTENWESARVIQDDEYENAVKYLREAVHSKPPIEAAILPLVQLLLIGGKVKDALHDVEQFSGNSNAALPNRIRSHLLDHVDPNNYVVLSTCFEDALKRDPTCSKSLAKLISLHQNGNYSCDSLLEMIALHLDAVFVDYNTWREFASCFIKVSQYDEDRMSACLHGNGGKDEGFSTCYNRIPNFLIYGKSGKDWRIRCRWWLTRHFSRNTLSTEMAIGDLQLLTYKAASASHMYGSNFGYVREAQTCLKQENNKELLMFLEQHMQNSIGFYSKFKHRIN